MESSREVAGGWVRGRDWTRVARGAHRLVDAEDEWLAELAAWQLVLPESAAFTGLTVARVLGWWLPPLPADLPVFVAMGRASSRPVRPGLVVCRHPEPPGFALLNGIRIAAPADALLACARVVGLLDLADGRAESAFEVLLRVLHDSCGIDVEPQYEVFDEYGGFVARGDLWLVRTTTLHEYDGADHLTRPRQRRDLARGRRVAGVEWVRRGYTNVEVLRQGVAILREADAAIGRAHRPERIRAWHELLRDSLFTPAGTARFRTRPGLARIWPGQVPRGSQSMTSRMTASQSPHS